MTRLLTLVPLMFVITSIVFFMVRFVPGDPARIMVGGQRISEQNLANIRKVYRLDQPLLDAIRLWVRDLLEAISAVPTGNGPMSPPSSSSGYRSP